MAKQGKKPIPKTQREISISQHEAFDTTRGNPNQTTPSSEMRGNHISFKGDDVKPFSLGLQDTTEAIFYYINNIIKPTVIQNGNVLNVPVVYGDAEKWKQVQKDGFYRDKNKKIMMPLIIIKRNNIQPLLGMSNKMDANSPNNLKILTKKYSPVNAYSNFNLLNNTKELIQYYAVVIPDYITITYDVIISTYYIEQLDKIIEAMNYASNSYWGNPDKFKFRASIVSFNTPVEVSTSGERTVKSTFQIKIDGYIVPEVTQKQLSSIKKFSSKNKIEFTTEIIENNT